MRRPDPNNIAAAKRAGLEARLNDLMPLRAAIALLDEYDSLAADAGLSPTSDAYWTEIEAWIARRVMEPRQGAA